MPGVDEISATGWGQARFDGSDASYSSIDPSNAAKLMSLDLSEGSLADLGVDGVVVSRQPPKTAGGGSATPSKPTSPRRGSTSCASSAHMSRRAGLQTTSCSACSRSTHSLALS